MLREHPWVTEVCDNRNLQQGQPCAEKQVNLLSGRRHSCYLKFTLPNGSLILERLCLQGPVGKIWRHFSIVTGGTEGRTRVPLTFEAWDSFYNAKLPSRHVNGPEIGESLRHIPCQVLRLMLRLDLHMCP